MRKILLLSAIAFIEISMVQADPALFLSHIKNETPDTLYKVIVPDENYEMLVPPGQDADFGQWLDLLRAHEVQLAAIGEDAGDPIFVTRGPESAGCSADDIAQSVIYWCGAPSVDANNKNYKTCCMRGDLTLELIIHPDGSPEIAEIIESAHG